MADNFVTDPAAGGVTFAADDISSVFFPRVKIAIGANGTNDGDVASGNPLPVTAASLPLPSGASTAARQDTGNTSLASIDGKITAVNTGAVVVSSSALPSGAATSAKQDSQTTLLAGGLPAALAANGGLKVEGIAGGVAQPVSIATAPALVAGSAIIGAIRLVNGKIIDNSGNLYTIKNYFGAPASSGSNAMIALVSSKNLLVLAYAIQATGTVVATFTETTPTAIGPAWTFQAREGLSRAAPENAWLFQSGSGKGIMMNLSAAVAVNVEITYAEQD